MPNSTLKPVGGSEWVRNASVFVRRRDSGGSNAASSAAKLPREPRLEWRTASRCRHTLRPIEHGTLHRVGPPEPPGD